MKLYWYELTSLVSSSVLLKLLALVTFWSKEYCGFEELLACFELISSSFTWYLSLARTCLQLCGQSSRVPGERLFSRRCQRRTRMAKTHECFSAVLHYYSPLALWFLWLLWLSLTSMLHSLNWVLLPYVSCGCLCCALSCDWLCS